MIHAIATAIGRPATKVKVLPWPLIGLGGLFQETPRELYRMRHVWRTPVRLGNRKLVAFLGEEPHTPLNEAVRVTLAALKVR